MPDAAAPVAHAPVAHAPRPNFVHNVLWGWLGVGVNMIIGLLLAPVIIRKLGVVEYGLWVLLFSMLDYLRMLDFGFRAAVVNGCARARARQDWTGVNATVSTALVYFLVAGLGSSVVAIVLRDPLVSLFGVPADLRRQALGLVMIIALSVGLRLMLSPLTATLEAFQRFELVNRAYVSALLVRSIGSLAALLAGYGLLTMAWIILAAQALENVWTFLSVRRVVPGFRLSPSMVSRDRLASLFEYGRHSAVMVIANMFSLQAPATVIGLLRGPADVGIFALPQRLLLYSAEALARVSDVTSSVTAELDEARSRERVWRLAVVTNRTCLALFVPLAIFLWFYGTPLLRLLVPAIAEASGPLIRIMLLYFVFAVAGQYNAGAVLIGQAKHAPLAWGVVGEVVLTVAALFVVVPQYGVVGAAWVVTAAILLVRGVYVAVLICRVNGFPLREYVTAIYAGPVLSALPVALVAFGLDRILPGRSWTEMILAGAAIAALYYALAFWSVLEPGQRAAIFARLRRTPRS